MATITPLPTPVPSRQDPSNFAARADAFLSALPTFGTETNAVAAEVNTNKNTAVSSANTATTQAGIATTAASTATTQAGIATTKAGEALASANNAAASFDAFDDRFLGSKASNPTLDNDGNALLEGAMYWNTASKQMRVWDGSAWTQTFLPAGAYLQVANNLSDIASAATARTNLGLGTAAIANIGTSGDAVPKLNAANTFSSGQEVYNGAGYNYIRVRRLDQKAPGVESAATIDVSTGNGDARLLSVDVTNNLIRWLRVKNAGGAIVTDSTGVEREIYHTGNTGTAVTADVTTGATDTTAGRLLKVGDFGVGAPALTLVSNTGDWNTATIGGAQYMGFNCINAPIPGMWFIGVTHQHDATYQVQEVSTFTTSYPRKFVRGNVAGVWSSWAEVFTQKSILGTVSQASGVPTGAIIERGANANGEYIRFADGTQICVVQLSGTTAATTASGSSFISSELNWTLPAAFTFSTTVSASGCVLGTGACTIRNTNITTTVVSFRLHSSVSGTFNNPRIFAIGRWY